MIFITRKKLDKIISDKIKSVAKMTKHRNFYDTVSNNDAVKYDGLEWNVLSVENDVLINGYSNCKKLQLQIGDQKKQVIIKPNDPKDIDFVYE